MFSKAVNLFLLSKEFDSIPTNTVASRNCCLSEHEGETMFQWSLVVAFLEFSWLQNIDAQFHFKIWLQLPKSADKLFVHGSNVTWLMLAIDRRWDEFIILVSREKYARRLRQLLELEILCMYCISAVLTINNRMLRSLSSSSFFLMKENKHEL